MVLTSTCPTQPSEYLSCLPNLSTSASTFPWPYCYRTFSHWRAFPPILPCDPSLCCRRRQNLAHASHLALPILSTQSLPRQALPSPSSSASQPARPRIQIKTIAAAFADQAQSSTKQHNTHRIPLGSFKVCILVAFTRFQLLDRISTSLSPAIPLATCAVPRNAPRDPGQTAQLRALGWRAECFIPASKICERCNARRCTTRVRP